MTDPSIVVNGQERLWPSPKTISALISELQLPVAQVAIAVNDSIVPRSRHAEVVVTAGDRIEIVQPVGGG